MPLLHLISKNLIYYLLLNLKKHKESQITFFKDVLADSNSLS